MSPASLKKNYRRHFISTQALSEQEGGPDRSQASSRQGPWRERRPKWRPLPTGAEIDKPESEESKQPIAEGKPATATTKERTSQANRKADSGPRQCCGSNETGSVRRTAQRFQTVTEHVAGNRTAWATGVAPERRAKGAHFPHLSIASRPVHPPPRTSKSAPSVRRHSEYLRTWKTFPRSNAFKALQPARMPTASGNHAFRSINPFWLAVLKGGPRSPLT